MALVGLLVASHPRADIAEEPRATLRIAGQALIERNLGLLRRAGVARTIVLVDLSAPRIERILTDSARQGLDIVENAADMATLLNDDDRVLLIEEGVLLDERLVLGVARAPAVPALAVWPPPPEGPGEAIRLDADHAFASVALLSGHALRVMARELGDWDLEQSALRVALNDGRCTLMPVSSLVAADAAAAPLWQPMRADRDREEGEALLLARRPHSVQSWPVAWIFDPLAAWLLRWVWRRQTGAGLPFAVAVVMAMAVAVLFAFGFNTAALVLALLYGLLVRLTLVGTEARGASGRHVGLMRQTLQALPLFWLAVVAARGLMAGAAPAIDATPASVSPHGWLLPALLAWLLAGQIVMTRVERLYAVLSGQPLALASRRDRLLVLAAPQRDALCLLLLPFAATGLWPAGLGIAALAVSAYGLVLIERVRTVLRNRPAA